MVCEAEHESDRNNLELVDQVVELHVPPFVERSFTLLSPTVRSCKVALESDVGRNQNEEFGVPR